MKFIESQIKDIVSVGETTEVQFKSSLNNEQQLAEEICAFLNKNGGLIIVGVSDNRDIVGLDQKQINDYTQWISGASNQQLIPPCSPNLYNVHVDDKLVMVIEVEEGSQKPYQTKTGKYLTRAGADKRILTQAELVRIIQEQGLFYPEEQVVVNTHWERDLDLSSFYLYFERAHDQVSVPQYLERENVSLHHLLQVMKIAKNDQLTLAGLLFFGKNPQLHKPLLDIKFVHYPSSEIEDTIYLTSQDLKGSIEILSRQALMYIKSALVASQNGQSFNSTGVLEINELALEEVIVNALIHRDYARDASVKILVFNNRLEIISPGVLPNHLTIDGIKNGISNARNPALASFSKDAKISRLLGSGVKRVVKLEPETEFLNDTIKQEFKVVFKRKLANSK